jgi:hypothetical protein
VSICLDRSDVTDRALFVSASWEHGSIPARPIVGIQVEQAIAVDAEEWGRCRSHGWVTAVADELSNEQEKVALDRIRAVASPRELSGCRFVTEATVTGLVRAAPYESWGRRLLSTTCSSFCGDHLMRKDSG